MIEDPGAYQIPEDAYHEDPCPAPSLSSTLGRLMLDATPKHVWYAHPKLNPEWQPKPPSARLNLGSAAHKLLLGEGAELAVLDYANYLTKAAKADRDAALDAGETPILREQYERAQDMVGAARSQLEAAGFKDLAWGQGEREVTVATEEGGVWLRAMLDWWGRDRTLVADYKTYDGYATPDAFGRHVSNFGYDFQDSFYQRVVAHALPELAGRLRFVFIVQEINPPYPLAIFEISEADRSVATRKVRAAVRAWESCLQRGAWPAHPLTVQRLCLPEWHHRRWLERELEAEESGEDSPDWLFAGGGMKA